jgi:beta-lactamase superfamily II metal-dependent hydrolase
VKTVNKALLFTFCTLLASSGLAETNNRLGIHYINIGQGGSTLIIGPDGTTVLYDFGVKSGDKGLVPYLLSVLGKTKSINYAILSHRDKDHFYGYRGLIEAGFNITVANFEPDGDEKNSEQYKDQWLDVSQETSAGKVRKIPVGLNIALGDGATMFVAASNGVIFDGTKIKIFNENDRSISLLISYKNFQYIIDGDLGGGSEACSGHETTQVDVQTPVAKALINHNKISQENGVDVFHVAHHGSESSTPIRYVSLIKPEVGLISVGNPNCNYRHPRKDVTSPLFDDNPTTTSFANSNLLECPSYQKLKALFQTDFGSAECDSTTPGKETHNNGIVSGDIILNTDGLETYQIFTSGMIWKNGLKVHSPKAAPQTYCLDEYKASLGDTEHAECK